MHFAIIKSEFNSDITEGLFLGAKEVLEKEKKNFKVFNASGAFEMPLLAKTLAKTGKYSGVICLGCVIKGETKHFEYISLASSIGIMNVSIEIEVPISFGILTVLNKDQALKRISGEKNKGIEAALACIKSANLINR